MPRNGHAGGKLASIRNVLNHQSPGSTAIYARLNTKAVDRALQAQAVSEIRIQHDPVPGFTCVKSGKGLVDLAHREMLGLRCDLVP